MSQGTLRKVLEQITTLEADELQEVRRAVQERLASTEERNKHARFYQALVASGLIREIKNPPAADVPERRLAEVQGEPVSETIIQERR